MVVQSTVDRWTGNAVIQARGRTILRRLNVSLVYVPHMTVTVTGGNAVGSA